MAYSPCIEIKLLEHQIDLILKALELYGFNLHHTWGVKVDDDEIDAKNCQLFYTYNMLLEYKRDKSYRISYDFATEWKLLKRNKQLRAYKKVKNKIA